MFCPHCREELHGNLMEIRRSPVRGKDVEEVGGLFIFCPHCRKILHLP